MGLELGKLAFMFPVGFRTAPLVDSGMQSIQRRTVSGRMTSWYNWCINIAFARLLRLAAARERSDA